MIKTKVQQQLAQIKLFMIESTAHFAETKMNAAKFSEANFPAIRVRWTNRVEHYLTMWTRQG